MGKGSGKRQHQKDKLYITTKEMSEEWSGYRRKQEAVFKALPFFCCGLSLLPFDSAVCTKEGIVFDVRNIIAYIKRYKRNPVTGDPLTARDLIPLHFERNSDNEYHCPITYKVFNHHSHIQANAKSGFVYSAEAIEQLNRKTHNWHDLMTGKPFTVADLITIQNPKDVESRKIASFHYIQQGLKVPVKEAVGVDAEEGSQIPKINETHLMRSIFKEMSDNKPADSEEVKPEEKEKPDTLKRDLSDDEADYKKMAQTKKKKHKLETNKMHSAGFTSTVIPTTKFEYRELTEDELLKELYEKVHKAKQKGYVRLETTLGNLNIELHCDWVPITCDNFLRHCEAGYYNGTIFHRVIHNFMAQGGDPKDTQTLWAST
eukprot:Platyproteum_vivax@DN5623_c0_g1_i15.p1